MDETQIARLADAGHALRPDWPVKSLITFLTRNFASRAYRDVALVLTNVATIQPHTDTPRLMLEDWPWQVTATATGASEAKRHPSAVPVEQLCHHCGRDETHCRTTARTDAGDIHVYQSRRDALIAQARADRAAREAKPEPEWSPSERAYWPKHLKAETLAAIRVGVEVVKSIDADIAARQRRGHATPEPTHLENA